MKFAKVMKEQQLNDWGAQYLEYKDMKKFLKLHEEDEVVSLFSGLLQGQLQKVRAFMKTQQEALLDALLPLNAHSDLVSDAKQSLVCVDLDPLNRCQHLVHTIQNFRDYAMLNHEAARKILKKFRKRVGSSAPPLTAACFSYKRKDFNVWLLNPAQRCVELLGTPESSQAKQFHFWVEELKAGLHLSGNWTVDQPEFSTTRLQFHPNLCVKNTFITTSSDDAPLVRRKRLFSDPLQHTGDAVCDSPQPAVQLSEVQCVGIATLPSIKGTDKPGGATRQQQRVRGDARASSRWWGQCEMLCPLTGFPIAMLPYPPFKIQTAVGAQLVDGSFLVISAIASWDFSVLGRTLDVHDVCALDAYMKKCKLGPWRLSKTMEMSSAGTPMALSELANIRERARRRCQQLWHIKQMRLAKVHSFASTS